LSQKSYEFGGRASSTPTAAATVACVDFVNPGLDFVRPELVAVFITNV
jgi:hypothetical protein